MVTTLMNIPVMVTPLTVILLMLTPLMMTPVTAVPLIVAHLMATDRDIHAPRGLTLTGVPDRAVTGRSIPIRSGR